MTRCLHAHAAHPDWRMALALAAAQLDAQRETAARAPQGEGPFEPTLGLVYFSDRYAAEAKALLADLRRRWPGVAWVGGSGIGVLATGVEYFDEAALALMLVDLPEDQFRVFSGTRPLPPRGVSASADARQWTALVHADARVPDLAGLVAELAQRTGSGCLFGGIVSGHDEAVQIADEVLQGGLSGVAFHQEQPVLTRLTQGCQPIGERRRITRSDGVAVLTLDGEPALSVLLHDLGLRPSDLRRDDGRVALSATAVERLRGTLVALTAETASHDERPDLLPGDLFGPDTWVRHLVGIDPTRQSIVLAESVDDGQWLSFCRRDAQAARRDLLRVGAELREEVSADETVPMDLGASQFGQWRFTPSHEVAGAIYISCLGRGGPHFGGDSAELQWLRHALGDVPLVGFFAGGEIAQDRVYSYSGVLTLLLCARP